MPITNKQYLANDHLEVSDTNWDDLKVELEAYDVPGVNEAELEQFGTTGLYLWVFDEGESLHFRGQLPHSYKIGTDLHLHIHWIPSTNSTGIVNWQVEYQIKNFGEIFNPSVNLSSETDLYDVGNGIAYKHQITGIHMVNGINLRESACIFGRIRRLNDSFIGDPFLLSVDFHIQQSKLGTYEEYPGA